LVALRVALPYRKQAALQRQAALVGPRLESYSKVVPSMLDSRDDVGNPREVPPDDRTEFARQLRAWYYTDGGALLLTGDAFNAYRDAHRLLLDSKAAAKEVADSLSKLRTELKLDIGSRQTEEPRGVRAVRGRGR